MAARAQITDRGLRYRANRAIPNHPKVCAFCGARKRIEVGHVNGDESDNAPVNLTWTCRPCNVLAANTLRSEGMGRLTHQYNPSKSGGASNIGEWLQAVGAITPHQDRGDRGLASTMSVSDAVAMIRATPHSKRSEFARKIQSSARGRSAARWNSGNWTGQETENLVLAARTARSPEELGRLFRHAERNNDFALAEAVRARVQQLGLQPSDFKKNPWPFSSGLSHGAIPATGGIAHHTQSKKIPVRMSDTSYRGYKIARTEGGEWFSTLDPDSWYETPAKVKRAIDSYLKGRSNPSKFDRCVKEVQQKGGAYNAYAVCSAAGAKNPGITIVPLGLYDVQQIDALGRGIYHGLKKRNGKKNPLEQATSMYESFHGRPSKEVVEVDETVHYHEALAELGELKQLRVKARDGSVVYLSGFGGSLLCADEQGTQLFIRGGDQSVDLGEFGISDPHEKEDLGEVKQIRYFTTKDHLGSEGGTATFYHDFGEEDLERGERPRRPRLVYSVRDKLLSLVGGGYTIKPEGIAN
jgi:hypothetical protein